MFCRPGFASIDASTIAAARRAALFGRDADFAEHFLNRDDIVPSTNVPVRTCHVVDVTGASLRKDFRAPSSGKLLEDLGARLLLVEQLLYRGRAQLLRAAFRCLSPLLR